MGNFLAVMQRIKLFWFLIKFFEEYIVNLKVLNVTNAIIVLTAICLYQSNKTAATSKINGIVNYGTNPANTVP